MRCPKCSYISFDDLVSCSKCAADLMELMHNLRGTSIGTVPSFFLATVLTQPESPPEGPSRLGIEADWGGGSSPFGDDAPAGVEPSQEIIFTEGRSAGMEIEEAVDLELPLEPNFGSDLASSQIQFAPEDEPETPPPPAAEKDIPTLDLPDFEMVDLGDGESLQADPGTGDEKDREETVRFDLSSLDLSDLLTPPSKEPSGLKDYPTESGAIMDLELMLEPEKPASDSLSGHPEKGPPKGTRPEGKIDDNELKLEDLSLDLLPDE